MKQLTRVEWYILSSWTSVFKYCKQVEWDHISSLLSTNTWSAFSSAGLTRIRVMELLEQVQTRATKTLKWLGHLSYKGSLGKLWLAKRREASREDSWMEKLSSIRSLVSNVQLQFLSAEDFKRMSKHTGGMC